MAERVDRLVKPSATDSIHAANSEQYKYNEILSTNRDILDALQNIMHQPHNSASSQNDKTAICISCKKSHSNTRPSGKLWPKILKIIAKNLCLGCFDRTKLSRSIPFQNDPLYNKPLKSATPYCRDCKTELDYHSRKHGFSKCKRCYSFSRQSKLNSVQIRSKRVDIDQISNDLHRSQAKAIGAEKIFELSSKLNYNPTRYRMIAKITNKIGYPTLEGLIDTGCNVEAMSLDACKKLHHNIKPSTSTAPSVEGRPIEVIGSIHTTLLIGKVSYESTFQVLRHIEDYDMMIGTRFLQSNDLMPKVVSLMRDALGFEHVKLGN